MKTIENSRKQETMSIKSSAGTASDQIIDFQDLQIVGMYLCGTVIYNKERVSSGKNKQGAQKHFFRPEISFYYVVTAKIAASKLSEKIKKVTV